MTTINSKPSSLSVFFPCYNEEKNITLLVKDFLDILPKIVEKFEILIINDGSTDNTKQVAERLSQEHSFIRLINHTKNLGYGSAIKTGIQNCQYEWFFFTDGDRQFDVSQLADFAPYTHDYGAIIGYREDRADGKIRALNARIFKSFVDVIFRLHVKDIDCAFKLIKTDLVKGDDLISNGAMISTEILYRLKKKKIKIKQLPVTHFPRKYGSPTGNNLKVIIKAGVESSSLYYHLKFRPKHS